MSVYNKIIQKLINDGGKLSSFTIVLPDQTTYKAGSDDDKFKVIIKDNCVFREVALKGDLGIGEQYMVGNIEIIGDLNELLRVVYISLVGQIEPNVGTQLLERLKALVITNIKPRSLKNVSAHYDISNDFYSLFLDKTFTYSCAYFKDDSDTLEQAQLQKYEHISKKLMLKEGETLVDFGCGWGGMLIYAAKKYKIKGYGVTLSKEQVALANKRIIAEHLEDLVKVEFKDYRDVNGQFDKFISIGMFEHVGWEFYLEYLKKVKSILKPKALAYYIRLELKISNIEKVLGLIDIFFQEANYLLLI